MPTPLTRAILFAPSSVTQRVRSGPLAIRRGPVFLPSPPSVEVAVLRQAEQVAAGEAGDPVRLVGAERDTERIAGAAVFLALPPVVIRPTFCGFEVGSA